MVVIVGDDNSLVNTLFLELGQLVLRNRVWQNISCASVHGHGWVPIPPRHIWHADMMEYLWSHRRDTNTGLDILRLLVV